MLQSTVVLFVVALLAGALGFSSAAATLSDVASLLFFAFVVVFVTRDLLERTREQAVPHAGTVISSPSVIPSKR